MRNNKKNPKIRRIMKLAEKLPVFSFADLLSIEEDGVYLKILLSRYAKKGALIRLKKGLYAAESYILQTRLRGAFNDYLEFIANILKTPSYLSLDYVLYEHSLLTEMPANFTSITSGKPESFSNKFGIFFYRKIKPELFAGYEIFKKGDYYVSKASKPKALFDWLYLRKNVLSDKKSFEELRLNLDVMKRDDWRELKRYVELEGSKKMNLIYKILYGIA